MSEKVSSSDGENKEPFVLTEEEINDYINYHEVSIIKMLHELEECTKNKLFLDVTILAIKAGEVTKDLENVLQLFNNKFSEQQKTRLQGLLDKLREVFFAIKKYRLEVESINPSDT